MYLVLKILITTLLVVVISELARRSSLVAGILASVPLVSVMAMIWLYNDSKDIEQVSALANSVFWLVLPSLVLFLLLPVLLKAGLGFYSSLFISIAATVASYGLMLLLLSKLGIRL